MHAEALLGHVPLNPLSSLPASVWKVAGPLQDAYNKYLGEREAFYDKGTRTYHVVGGKGYRGPDITIPKYCDYTHDKPDGDLTYLQAMPNQVFDAMQQKRQAGPGFTEIANKHIHDSEHRHAPRRRLGRRRP